MVDLLTRVDIEERAKQRVVSVDETMPGRVTDRFEEPRRIHDVSEEKCTACHFRRPRVFGEFQGAQYPSRGGCVARCVQASERRKRSTCFDDLASTSRCVSSARLSTNTTPRPLDDKPERVTDGRKAR